MAVIDFLTKGGLASSTGDLNNAEQMECNEFIKKFASKVKELGRQQLIPANQLSIFRMNFLFIAKDLLNFHFAFIDKPGMDVINYRDFTSFGGSLPLDGITDQLRLEYGEIHWAFTVPINLAKRMSAFDFEHYANEYINTTIQAIKQTQSEQIKSNLIPELSKHVDAFKRDFPDMQKTAFLIMQFGDTKAHSSIVSTIKDTLKNHNIIGLRADDKEYADDLFLNIRTYMHCCDFGISIFERVTEDDFNPNVSLEVGYMLGLGKSVCLLKDKTLKNLQTDLIGKLYKPFDTLDIMDTLPNQLEKWLNDKGLI